MSNTLTPEVLTRITARYGEDVLQDTLATLLNTAGDTFTARLDGTIVATIPTNPNTVAWTWRTASNISKKAHRTDRRRIRREERTTEIPVINGDPTTDDVLSHINHDQLHEALETLRNHKPLWATIIVAYHLQDYTTTQIAEHLNLTTDNTRKILIRARHWLRNHLTQND